MIKGSARTGAMLARRKGPRDKSVTVREAAMRVCSSLSMAAFILCQGGSTTMWIDGQPNSGVITRTCENAVCDPRQLANGLFIQALD